MYYYLSSYISTIVSNYIHYISYSSICIVHFSSRHILSYFYFITKHFNLQLKVFIDLCTVDLLVYKLRFYNIYNALSIIQNMRMFSKTYISKILKIESVGSIYKNSIWYERESWELFGIVYLYHNDLRRLLTDYSFKGFPLRKDFPIAGFSELRYCYDKKRIIYGTIRLIQAYRSFKTISPWGYYY